MPLRDIGRLKEAIEFYRQALVLEPKHATALGELVHALQMAGNWRDTDADGAKLLSGIRQGVMDVPPFVLFFMPATPADQLRAAIGGRPSNPKV